MQRSRKPFLVVLLVLLMITAASILFQQPISDWLKLRGYQAPAAVAALADTTGMKPDARRLFFVNHPEIADAAQFNQHCRENEFTIVLGCYLSGQSGIYLLHVSDERLAGVMEVTAAHEFLHAAYERLSSADKQRVDSLLQQVFDGMSNNRIRETIELYRKQDPTIVANELHSIIGTEVRSLPKELEEYYARYFTDRSKVVAFSEQYEQAFIDRRNAIRDYDAQLASLKSQIEALSTQLTRTDAELQAQRRQMNSLRASGQTEEYNALVPSYNAKVNQYNQDVDRLSGLVVQYNDIVQSRNSIAAEEAELVKAIDSRDIVPEQQ